jgi:2-amino-4-hydroxy-6-hydroxymethyldihydropteridine diphosphokinase
LSELEIPVQAYITLGSNIDPARNLARAVQMLRQNHHLIVRAVSPVYCSAPLDATGAVNPAQADFLNAAAWLETDHYTAHALKYTVLRFIETCLGRERSEDKFAPRPIDLDLALYADCVITDAQLTLPDPDILTKAHIALPLADIAPDVVHPVAGRTLAQIAAPFRDAAGITVQPDFDLNA